MKYLNQMENYINKTFCFDIDGVICTTNCHYQEAIPNQDIINIINKLYDLNNIIILNTSRGYKSGLNWKKLTSDQLEKWNVKYHKLLFTKPSADYYVDDRNLSIEDLKLYEL